jgi:hypothetical protein
VAITGRRGRYRVGGRQTDWRWADPPKAGPFTKWAFPRALCGPDAVHFEGWNRRSHTNKCTKAMRNAEVFFRAGWLATLAAGLALGSGCGSGDQPATTMAASAKARKQAKAELSTKPGQEDLADMVAAVGTTKAGTPVELKFALTTRPEVGQVMDLDVAVVPHEPIPESLSVSFQVADGLDIVDGSQLQRVDKLMDGTPIRHVVRILPKRDGIFALTAVVSFASSSQDWSRTFSIPVIAGEGLPEQVAKSAP